MWRRLVDNACKLDQQVRSTHRVQEGGVMLAASWLAMPTDLALAAVLIRRIRDLLAPRRALRLDRA